MRFYHVTPWRNVENIRRHGLVPRKIKRGFLAQDPEEPRIYLFVDRDTAEDAMANWLLDEHPKDRFFGIVQIELPEDAPVREDAEVAGSVYMTEVVPAAFLSAIEKIDAGEAS